MRILRNHDGALGLWLFGIVCLVGGYTPWAWSIGRPPTGPRASPDLDRLVRKFETSCRNISTLRADFTQAYTWGGRRREESGVAAFARGGRMRWEYQKPKKKLVVSDGKRLWLFVPEEMQVTRSSLIANEDPRVPFPLLFSHFDLHRIFSRIEIAGEAPKIDSGDLVLRGYPKRGLEDEYREILIELTPALDLRRLLITYPDQTTMEFTFSRIEKNLPLSPRLFRFTPPPGAEIIEQ